MSSNQFIPSGIVRRFWRRFIRALSINTLQKRLLVPILLTSLLLGLTTVFNVMSINSIVDRINETYQSNADLYELSQLIARVEEHTESYLSTRSSTSLENYYKQRDDLTRAMELLDIRSVDSERIILEKNIYNMILSWLDETELAISAKRGRDVEQYIAHFDEARVIFGYINEYISRLNTVQFRQNYDNYHNMGQVLNTVEVMDLLIVSVVLIANTIIILLATLRITRPVVQLAHQAEEVARGNLDVEEIRPGTSDELSVLTRSFHGMVVSLRDYVVRIRENTIKENFHQQQELTMLNYLQEAKLKNLQAQINPHFLFNSLNAGAQLAMMEGADKTTELIENIADFYRYNIKIFDHDATLRQELEMVSHYIYIQKVRFADRFDFKQTIDDTCLEVRMPSLILQPIVENAFAHGLRDMESDGLIKIEVMQNGDNVLVCVTDNGSGFDQVTIDKLMSLPQESINEQSNQQSDSVVERQGAGIALSNVISRLRLFYRRDDVLEIKSDEEIGGARICLFIPLDYDSSHVDSGRKY
ncbi:MAG: two-component system, sensor histidine kinase YesM [Clostridiales bacterium]|jgi:sensor histidine kinase YesM|nr:two-component system, sensor histidine kinase YesM [Clostridiales bacterium]